MKRTPTIRSQFKNRRWRFWIINSLFISLLIGLLFRMVDLTILDQHFLRTQGEARSVRTIQIPAYRGMITDRNGEPLAISTPVFSAWINPKDFKPMASDLRKLSLNLNLSAQAIKHRVENSKEKEFVYIKRGMTPQEVDIVRNLKIEGVNFQREFHRYYPQGEVSAHVLGFTDIDDQGQEGIELQFEEWLHGKPGKKYVLKDRLGHVIADIDNVLEPHPGHNLVLSIDQRIQYIAYHQLKKAVDESQAKSGSAVVLDAHSGEILAMVNQPSYNPNTRYKEHDGRYRNRAVTDMFEPGSVMKAFSIAAALSSKKYTPNTKIDTHPSWLVVNGKTINDPHDNGVITVTQVLQRSSNVGVTKMILSIAQNKFTQLLSKVGFGQRTQSGFPGESSGILTDNQHWKPFSLATLAFGYGISLTTLQLAHAYSLFANDGMLVPVSLLRLNHPPKPHRVLSKKTAHQMLRMLEQVVDEEGTGNRAKVIGYTVAGKTGTARIVGPNGYDEKRHLANFVGIVPVTKPRFVIAIVINEPQKGSYYGGVIAAPVFSEIAGRILRTLNIPPDNLESRT